MSASAFSRIPIAAATLRRLFVIGSVAFGALGVPAQVSAQEVDPACAAPRRAGSLQSVKIEVAAGHSKIVPAGARYAEVFVGASETADVMPVTATEIYVLGKKVGTTNITYYDKCKSLLGVFQVEVTPDTSFIQQKIRETVPGARAVSVTSANGSLVLTGSVRDAPTAERAVAIATAFSKEVVNILQVSSPQQVLLEVRVVEATRNAGRELGVRWDLQNRTGSGYGAETGVNSGRAVDRASGQVVSTASQLLSGATPFGVVFANVARSGNVNLDVTIQALEEKGLVRRLANPNLTALSGSTANFLAGGEFPVPVGGTTAGGFTETKIEFKRFGVMLDFTPTVLGDSAISLKVTPEVSELDYANTVKNAGITIPSIVVRRASTEIILKSGQSFAIAGLLAETGRTQAAQLPWLGDVPVLGALFRSQAYQKRETELVIFVTAHLAQPGSPRNRVATPLDKTIMGNDADVFLHGQSEVPRPSDAAKPKGPQQRLLDVDRAN